MNKCFLFLLLLITNVGKAQVKPTPAAERLQSIQQRKQLRRSSPLNHIPFRNVGPSIMGGRVVALEVNPNDATEFYVAYATGGLWHSTNNGQSFRPIFDSEDVLFIGDIAVFWNGQFRTIWIGTGEVNSSRSSYAGIGIYKSLNNGNSWQYMGLPESHHIGKIQLHPTNRNIAWVAAMGHLYSSNKERGVFKTTDGGRTWKHTLAVDENTGAVEMDINPNDPNELYAATWYRTRRAWNFEEGGKTSGIYKSGDGGETWKLLTTPGSGFPTGDRIGRIGISVYPGNPQVVYAIVDNQNHKPDTAQQRKDTAVYVLKDFKDLTHGQFRLLNEPKLDSFFKKNNIPAKYTARSVKELVAANKLKPTVIWDYLFDANAALFETPIIGAEVYRSNDGGISWKKANQHELKLYNTYGYYFGKIYVSPADENKVLILGVTIELSTDGGKTFKKIDKENVHADHHASWINPKRDSHIFSGNDGGLNISYDNGENWFAANTPPVGQFYAITVDNRKPYNVYGGLQDNGVWFGPSTHKENATWLATGSYPYKRLMGGDGMQVQVSHDSTTIYTGFQFGYYSRINTATKEMKSVKPVNDLGEEGYRFNWQTPILLSAHQRDVLYLGSNRFHRSLNKGDSIAALSNDLSTRPQQGDIPFGTITTITESQLRFGLLYTGTDDGNIHLSRDGGYSWTLVSGKLPKGLWVSRVAASAHKEGRVYAALNGYRNDNFLPYLFVSDDYGFSWKMVNGNLPFEPINVVREDSRHENLLYVGTDGGLYVSMNSGSSYFAWNNGLPASVPIHDIAVQNRENEIVLGTHGRSIYIAKLDSVHLLALQANYLHARQARASIGRDLPTAPPKKNTRRKRNAEGADLDCPPVMRRRG